MENVASNDEEMIGVKFLAAKNSISGDMIIVRLIFLFLLLDQNEPKKSRLSHQVKAQIFARNQIFIQALYFQSF
jgi:hypothetical protein